MKLCPVLVFHLWAVESCSKKIFNQEIEMIRSILEILEAERGWVGNIQEVARRASGSCGIFTHLFTLSELLGGGEPTVFCARGETLGKGPCTQWGAGATARGSRVKTLDT